MFTHVAIVFGLREKRLSTIRCCEIFCFSHEINDTYIAAILNRKTSVKVKVVLQVSVA